ncbi:Poly(3-hydroxyalkanoate) polymerase subunit PhaC [Paraburkholderia caffeinitolerans]|uniref:Poly(3-hydroxyalkanoate) polymerase subunit PhaC n=1 Tax=Paraburkholderia caffeinitolerans TaxID=1723730 RepID=A0A6J5G0A4_9BURK|nr:MULTISPECIES: class I poly(R)-hydroxyalkanoic acid synthase [Paraburkholderia]CAB3788599.1 Poly(3-hydroxyalkanoate) polymerase subunit PhaC [Paraburkholderia caffeinitolerans]
MTSPFHVPEEYVQGLIKASQSLWQATADTAPDSLAQLQADYWRQQTSLWLGLLSAPGAPGGEAVVAPAKGDRRFHGAAWRDNAWYSLLMQSYLLNANLLDALVERARLNAKEKHKLRFFTRQFIDAMSPANFAATNPEVLKTAVETQGNSVSAGLTNLMQDLRDGRVSITDESAFEVGRNVAVSQGTVVFENALFQLIQYAPLTDEVAARPLLIVPPCINKFYILDLQPENSFVRFAVEQGLTVFLVSWSNPGASLGQTTWDDYVGDGAIKALEVARAISKADQVNALGWCVGGTILSSAVAILRARGDESVASLTLLTTMLDFSDPGDLGVFIDEACVAQRELTIGQGGIYSGKELGFVFQTLRANDLLWPYVTENYLKGKTPAAFDLLYWNADATNLPGPMYAWYLRNMYLENNLRTPDRLTMCGTPVDLGRIDMPSYVLATLEDHIVPWKSAWRTTRLVGGDTRFVLGASGHIAGVINPPAKKKRSFWTDGKASDDPQTWLDSAQSTPGSWWTHWIDWLRPSCGAKVAAPKRAGNAQYKPIESAPGRYVRVRAG